MNLQSARCGRRLAGRARRLITDAALASAKFEGDYVRVMALSTPGAANPAPAAGGAAPAPAGAAQTTEKPAAEPQKEQPKN